jgi:hypothetical protein
VGQFELHAKYWSEPKSGSAASKQLTVESRHLHHSLPVSNVPAIELSTITWRTFCVREDC